MPAARFALPQLDRLALAQFASGEVGELLEHARALAEALASEEEGHAARRRTLGRALSVCRCQVDLVDAAIGSAMGRQDFVAMAALGRLADQLSRRLKMLFELHQRETARQQPVQMQMVIGHVGAVTVGGDK